MRPKLSTIFFVLIAVAGLCADRVAAQTASSSEPVTTASSLTPVTAGEKPIPTTEEILQKFENATGGHEVWSGFTTRTMKGIYQTEDASSFAGIETFSEAPNKGFTKITFPNGVTIREVCDGKSAWLEDPLGGMHEYTGAALESRVRAAKFNSGANALRMMAPGRVLAAARVGTHSTYVVEFSPQKNVTSKIYFDTESGLAVRADDTIHRDEGDYTVETYLDDYRPVDGAYFPFRLRHVEKGNVFTVRVTQIKNNPPVDDSIFVKPASTPNTQ